MWSPRWPNMRLSLFQTKKIPNVKSSNKIVAKKCNCLKIQIKYCIWVYIRINVFYIYIYVHLYIHIYICMRFFFCLSYKSLNRLIETSGERRRRRRKRRRANRRRNEYTRERWSGRVSIQLQRWISCLGGCTASNDREEIVTVFDTPRPIPPSHPLALSLALSHPFSPSRFFARARRPAGRIPVCRWPSGGSGAPTLSISSLRGPDRGTQGVGRTVRRVPEEPS